MIQLARESGQAHLERVATHNLAEHRLWEGELDEALSWRAAAYALQSRAGEGTTRPDRLLLARVLAGAAMNETELAELLETFRGRDRACRRRTGAARRCCAGIATGNEDGLGGSGWRRSDTVRAS